jgi:hypothetical protein
VVLCAENCQTKAAIVAKIALEDGYQVAYLAFPVAYLNSFLPLILLVGFMSSTNGTWPIIFFGATCS